MSAVQTFQTFFDGNPSTATTFDEFASSTIAFRQFFGFNSGSGGSGGEPESPIQDAIDYAFHLQLQHAGKLVTHVGPDGFLNSFIAIVHKERRTKVETDNGFEEMILREIKFPANDTTGQAAVLLHAEIRIQSAKYQIRNYERKDDFWVCELKRINVAEISRNNRRGKI